MAYLHKEAFCLMKYASRDGSVVEWLWNSRDGVTPFCLQAQDGETELAHVEWQLDRCLPGYKPSSGERIFVDFDEAAARESAKRMVEHYWDDPEYPMHKQFESREAAEEKMFEGNLDAVRNGAPMVVFARDWKQPTS